MSILNRLTRPDTMSKGDGLLDDYLDLYVGETATRAVMLTNKLEKAYNKSVAMIALSVYRAYLEKEGEQRAEDEVRRWFAACQRDVNTNMALIVRDAFRSEGLDNPLVRDTNRELVRELLSEQADGEAESDSRS